MTGGTGGELFKTRALMAAAVRYQLWTHWEVGHNSTRIAAADAFRIVVSKVNMERGVAFRVVGVVIQLDRL